MYTHPHTHAHTLTALIDYFREEAAKTLEEGPIKLTTENFDNIVNPTPLILVEFWADWCVHCQKLEPHFQAAARRSEVDLV